MLRLGILWPLRSVLWKFHYLPSKDHCLMFACPHVLLFIPRKELVLRLFAMLLHPIWQFLRIKPDAPIASIGEDRMFALLAKRGSAYELSRFFAPMRCWVSARCTLFRVFFAIMRSSDNRSCASPNPRFLPFTCCSCVHFIYPQKAARWRVRVGVGILRLRRAGRPFHGRLYLRSRNTVHPRRQ